MENNPNVDKPGRDKDGTYLGFAYNDFIDDFIQENKELYYEIVRGKCEERIIEMEMLKDAILHPSLDGMSERVYPVLTEFKIGINAIVTAINKQITTVENIYAAYGGRRTRKEMVENMLVWAIDDCLFQLREFLPSENNQKVAS